MSKSAIYPKRKRMRRISKEEKDVRSIFVAINVVPQTKMVKKVNKYPILVFAGVEFLVINPLVEKCITSGHRYTMNDDLYSSQKK
ncbi:MAG TPA: hypothetical protein P5286_06835 [Treponemataceae bacterium]|nr:hypothetical protein [Treponemataceae bacterium]